MEPISYKINIFDNSTQRRLVSTKLCWSKKMKPDGNSNPKEGIKRTRKGK